MFTRNTNSNESGLQKTIDSLIAELDGLTGDSPEYNRTSDQLVKLYKLKEVNPPKRLSPDQLLLVLGNFAGVLLIVAAERDSVVVSKALNFVIKSR